MLSDSLQLKKLVRVALTVVTIVESAYEHITGTGSAHCGGTNVSPLKDGTVYGWTGGTVEQCKAKCTADPTCNAFVWRDRDGGCHWKSGVTQGSIDRDYSQQGHSCYLHVGIWGMCP